jgi:hypothetical protein
MILVVIIIPSPLPLSPGRGDVGEGVGDNVGDSEGGVGAEVGS